MHALIQVFYNLAFPSPTRFDVFSGEVRGTYAVRSMPRRIHNWSYDDVTDFLIENGFAFLCYLRGSHQRWTKRGENGQPDKTVEVNLTRRSYPLKTLKRMILASGIDIDKWIEWTRS